MAPVIQTFLSLTGRGQDTGDAVVRRDLHLQTRIAKHLGLSLDIRAGNVYRITNSPLHNEPNERAENHLDAQ